MEKGKYSFKNILNKGMKNEKLVLLILGAVLLLVIAMPTSGSKEPDAAAAPKESRVDAFSYESQLENRIVEILQKMEGIGKVQVMVTVQNSTQKVLQNQGTLEENSISEKDSTGGTRDTYEKSRSDTYVLENSGSTQTPFVVEEKMPEIKGVVVVAQGGGNAEIVSDVTMAIEALLGVPAHKIKVLKMK